MDLLSIVCLWSAIGLAICSVYAYQEMRLHSYYWALPAEIKKRRKYKLLFVGSILGAILLFLFACAIMPTEVAESMKELPNNYFIIIR